MNLRKKNKIPNFIYEKATELFKKASESGENISHEKIKQLENLTKLERIRADYKPKNIWMLFSFILLTLIIVSILVFVSVNKTEIELDLKLSAIGFQLTQDQIIAPTMNLSILGVSGMREIQFPRTMQQPSKTIINKHGDLSIRLSNNLSKKNDSIISIAALALPVESRIYLESYKNSNQYLMNITASEYDLRVGLKGYIHVGLSNRLKESINFGLPKLMIFNSKPDEIMQLKLTLQNEAKHQFSVPIKVKNLSFTKIKDYLNYSDINIPPIISSTILDGKLYYESLNGTEKSIRSGEILQLEESTGIIRTLFLKNGTIHLQYRGIVSGMSMGQGESKRSIMPTILDWIKARHSLVLLWGTTLYLFSLAIGLLTWWRKSF